MIVLIEEIGRGIFTVVQCAEVLVEQFFNQRIQRGKCHKQFIGVSEYEIYDLVHIVLLT